MVYAHDSGSCGGNPLEVRLLFQARMKPLGKVNCSWTPGLAYAIGLIATDGCLYNDGRHMSLTSIDIDQIETFARILKLNNKIGLKNSSYYPGNNAFHFQFGDVIFYRFLESIGLTPRKSKTMPGLKIPTKYFRDFLRGHLDGDGSTYSYYDPRWRSSFMLYTTFLSASEEHLRWLQKEIHYGCSIKGKITFGGKVFRLRFAKNDSIVLYNFMYYSEDIPSLERKRLKFAKSIEMAGLPRKPV